MLCHYLLSSLSWVNRFYQDREYLTKVTETWSVSPPSAGDSKFSFSSSDWWVTQIIFSIENWTTDFILKWSILPLLGPVCRKYPWDHWHCKDIPKIQRNIRVWPGAQACLNVAIGNLCTLCYMDQAKLCRDLFHDKMLCIQFHLLKFLSFYNLNFQVSFHNYGLFFPPPLPPAFWIVEFDRPLFIDCYDRP